MSDESGTDEVYVQPFPPTGGKWQVSMGGGDEPAWGRDGRELFYLSLKGMLMSAEIATTSAMFVVKRRQSLFAVGLHSIGGGGRYDVTRDGQRFLVAVSNDKEPLQPISVVFNWPEELKRRASVVK